jgi:hypothetical protein
LSDSGSIIVIARDIILSEGQTVQDIIDSGKRPCSDIIISHNVIDQISMNHRKVENIIYKPFMVSTSCDDSLDITQFEGEYGHNWYEVGLKNSNTNFEEVSLTFDLNVVEFSNNYVTNSAVNGVGVVEMSNFLEVKAQNNTFSSVGYFSEAIFRMANSLVGEPASKCPDEYLVEVPFHYSQTNVFFLQKNSQVTVRDITIKDPWYSFETIDEGQGAVVATMLECTGPAIFANVHVSGLHGDLQNRNSQARLLNLDSNSLDSLTISNWIVEDVVVSADQFTSSSFLTSLSRTSDGSPQVSSLEVSNFTVTNLVCVGQ